MRPTEDEKAPAQDSILEFLADSKTFGNTAVRRIDTHAACVFLVGDRALKVKRAVKFPFLDYSTLDKRKAACEAELSVNRRFAPDIYRGIIAITRQKNGALAIGGRGAPVEWVVDMRRFDENLTLDHLADERKIDIALSEQLGRIVARAHAASEASEPRRWIEALATFITQNDDELRQVPELFPIADVEALAHASRQALDRLKPLLIARGRLGCVRRGHGDLHLGNIALIDGKPTLFDAIEFDPIVATGDVLYDLAFLIMDLLDRKLPIAANVVFNRYLIESARPENLDGLSALPLFLSLRAAIRAKVTAARRRRVKPPERPQIERAATGYFRLAQSLIAPPSPRMIAVGGLSGTGKSVLAHALAPSMGPAPGAVLLRSDVVRKVMAGWPETQQLPADAYRPESTRLVYAKLLEDSRRIVAAGHSVVVDAVFASPAERSAIAAAAEATHVPFQGLFLAVDLATRLARVGARGLDASDANAAIVRQQENYALGEMQWATIDASGSPDETLRRSKAVVTSEA